jgi:LacI family repressor for deo operon, udp, cdd, tsx, nupC, and nupG
MLEAMKRKNVTIEEIAKAANVSTATISRIINNKGNVTKETRNHVIDVMNQMEYKPHNLHPLSDPESRIILVCVPDFRNPFYNQVIDGIQKAAHEEKYNVLLLQSSDYYSRIEDFAEVFKEQSIAGIIILSSVPESDSELLNDLSLRCPVVMCSEYAENYGVSFVSINDVSSSEKAVSYLISTGCRKIGLLNSLTKFKYARHREKGYRQALTQCGLDCNENWIAHISSISYDVAYSTAMHILQLPNRPDALFCCSDVYGIATVNAAKVLGLRVPEDLSVIGFDNVDIARMSHPALTTIAQPMLQMGYQSCSLLIEKIQSPDTPDRQIILNTELIIRNSTKLPVERVGQ